MKLYNKATWFSYEILYFCLLVITVIQIHVELPRQCHPRLVNGRRAQTTFQDCITSTLTNEVDYGKEELKHVLFFSLQEQVGNTQKLVKYMIVFDMRMSVTWVNRIT